MSQRVPILVVDDSPAICKSISEILTNHGYEVAVVNNGMDAIAAIKNTKFHLVTLDVEMPGMAGTDVLRIIKAYDPDIFVIMISGVSALQTALHAIRHGAYDYINKPFDAEDMLLSVQRALRQRSLVLENRKLIADLRRLNENLEELVQIRTDALQKSEQKLKEYAQALEAAHAKLLANHEELESAYKKLKELDTLKAKFISIASHELRTPLTTIRGYAGFLAGGRTKSAELQTQALQAMERNIERLVSIVNEITDIAKLREKRMYFRKEPSDLSKIIGLVSHEVRPFVEERKQVFEIRIENPAPMVYVDWARIQQVLSNLILNAIRFTPDGGKITVSAKRDSANKGFVLVSVSDTGIGIGEDQLQKIFQEFYEAGPLIHHHSGNVQFQSSGMGLGLSFVKGIIEEHGGRIWAESQKSKGGVGSTFHFLLPETDLEERREKGEE